MCRASVVLPELSGPKISMTRPRGTPPIPIAASRLNEVVEIEDTSATSRSPRRMIDPLPNFFSILSSAASTAFPRSAPNLSSAITNISFYHSFSHEALGLELHLRPATLQTGRQYNTDDARMEQCFTRATKLFFTEII